MFIKNMILVFISLFLSFVLSTTAFAEELKTIKDCAKLLPINQHEYELVIDGKITGDRSFEGVLNLNDSNSNEQDKDVALFIECVKLIIK
ncbi:hypothetical protein [Enterobacter cloacae]|uniref:hypothetical protein n=1 Tax=Enterobacter cloacae TaxID=550 RepID=UPI002A4ABEDD|nr:hypothetical protein [Enterobacter cloacae]